MTPLLEGITNRAPLKSFRKIFPHLIFLVVLFMRDRFSIRKLDFDLLNDHKNQTLLTIWFYLEFSPRLCDSLVKNFMLCDIDLLAWPTKMLTSMGLHFYLPFKFLLTSPYYCYPHNSENDYIMNQIITLKTLSRNPAWPTG